MRESFCGGYIESQSWCTVQKGCLLSSTRWPLLLEKMALPRRLLLACKAKQDSDGRTAVERGDEDEEETQQHSYTATYSLKGMSARVRTQPPLPYGGGAPFHEHKRLPSRCFALGTDYCTRADEAARGICTSAHSMRSLDWSCRGSCCVVASLEEAAS